jgi:hypothetical protein
LWPAALAWVLLGLFVVGMVLVVWLDQLLRRAGRPELVQWDAEGATYAVLGLVSAAAVGVVVAGRRPGHPVGWLLLAFALLAVVSVAARGYVAYALLARPGALPAAGVAVVRVYALNVSGNPMPLLALAVLLTPTGSLPSPRWRWVAVALVVMAVVSAIEVLDQRPLEPPLQSVTSPLAIGIPPAGPLRVVYDLLDVVLGAAFVLPAAAVSPLLRFRRASGIERQQLRWWRSRRRWCRWRCWSRWRLA